MLKNSLSLFMRIDNIFKYYLLYNIYHFKIKNLFGLINILIQIINIKLQLNYISSARIISLTSNCKSLTNVIFLNFNLLSLFLIVFIKSSI